MLDELRELARALAARVETAPEIERADRARQLAGHVSEFLLPRAADLDAPLFAVILGSTGSGKSSLFNALAGANLSEVGVLRPTTRTAMALAAPGAALPAAVEQLTSEGELTVIRHDTAWDDLVLVDAPDFDSIEAANRALARRLLEAADLIVFVTTDTRYADEIPWTMLARARERGVPLLSVINRLPADPADRRTVLDDYRRLLDEAGMSGLSSSSQTEVVGVPLGAVDLSTSGLTREAAAPVRAVLERLVADDEARRALVRESLESALGELPSSVETILDEMELENAARNELLGIAEDAYTGRRDDIADQIDRGAFLRSAVLREWHDYVGANRVSRVIAVGVGKVAAGIRSVFRPGPAAPATEVREAAMSDLGSLVLAQVDKAAAEAAASWSRKTYGSDAVADHPHLWGASPDTGPTIESELATWARQTSKEIMEVGEQRRGVAKAASLGVNVIGTGAIIAVFAHTGGLTGAEAGIAAGTAVVNQALLEAVFGEANVARFVNAARARLDEVIVSVADTDRARFEESLGLSAATAGIATRLRDAVDALAR